MIGDREVDSPNAPKGSFDSYNDLFVITYFEPTIYNAISPNSKFDNAIYFFFNSLTSAFNSLIASINNATIFSY